MNIRIWLAAAATALASATAVASELGVSVHVGDYGRIDIGRVPTPPTLIYQQPVIVQQQPVAVQRSPIYMRVPPGHAKKWDKHCGRYNACGQPVYFVQENWYQQNVVQQRRHDGVQHRQDNQGHGNGHGKPPKHEKKHHGRDKHDKHDK